MTQKLSHSLAKPVANGWLKEFAASLRDATREPTDENTKNTDFGAAGGDSNPHALIRQTHGVASQKQKFANRNCRLNSGENERQSPLG